VCCRLSKRSNVSLLHVCLLNVVFGRPFVKLFALCYRTVVCPVLSVCDVGVLWPNGWMDQDATWYGGRSRTRRHCVRWAPISPQKGAHQPLPHFSVHVYWGETAGWIKMPLGTEVGLGPGDIVLNGHSIATFRPMSIVTKRLDASGYHLVWRWTSVPATLLDEDPALSRGKGHSSHPLFVYCGQMAYGSRCRSRSFVSTC